MPPHRLVADPLICTLLAAATLGAASACAAERGWELRGEFESLEPGPPEVVVLRLAGGGRVEVPLESLSESSRSAVLAAAAAVAPRGDGEPVAVTVRGPFGRAVRLQVAEIIKDVETDAIRCRTAAEAADVYRLYLAGERLAPERRRAAEARLKEWSALADQGVVRLGDRWVSPAEAGAAAAEAKNVVAHALELMRLGNGELAEDELRKAGRIDPESGRASFVMGLSYALVGKNPAKALEHFTEAVARQPGDAAAINDLAVLEVLTRRYAAIADHFRQAAENAADPAAVGENLAWAVKLAGAARTTPALARTKMPEKTVEELNAVYRLLTQERGLKPPENVAAPQYLGPAGGRCAAATAADVARHCAEAGNSPAVARRGLGFVIAPGRVVCPRHVVVADGVTCDEIEVEAPGERGRRVSATVIAAPDDGNVALLLCDELATAPLPLAERMPPLPEIAAIGPSGGSEFEVRPTAVRGRVVAPAAQDGGRGVFVHTAAVPRGAGGGPILDATGRVVGMVAAAPRAEASGNSAGFGIPVERIWSGIGKHLPKDVAPEPAATADAAAAERQAVSGTVLVSARKARPAVAPGSPR